MSGTGVSFRAVAAWAHTAGGGKPVREDQEGAWDGSPSEAGPAGGPEASAAARLGEDGLLLFH